MAEDERDRIILLEQIDNLSWERDCLREALQEMVADCDTLHPSTRADGQVMAYSILPGTLQRARAALGEEG